MTWYMTPLDIREDRHVCQYRKGLVFITDELAEQLSIDVLLEWERFDGIHAGLRLPEDVEVYGVWWNPSWSRMACDGWYVRIRSRTNEFLPLVYEGEEIPLVGLEWADDLSCASIHL